MVNVLLTMIITWWVQYRWRNVPHWTLFLFLWLLVAPLILYLVAALLFPTNQDDVVVTGWRQHYYANNKKIFALFGLSFAIDLVDTLLKGLAYFLSFGPLYYGSMFLNIALCAIAATTKSPRYHDFFAVFLSYLQPGNAWKQSAAADVGLTGKKSEVRSKKTENKEQRTKKQRLKSDRVLKQARENVGNEINQEVADHVCDEVASPKIKERECCAEHERDDDVCPAAGPVANRKDHQRDCSRPIAVEAERLQTFNGVAAIEQFFEHTARTTISVTSHTGSLASAAPDEPPV